MREVLAERSAVSAGRHVLLVIALLALASLACWPSTVALWDLWRWNPYIDGHGPFVAAVSLGLLVRSRIALAATQLRPSAMGAAGLVVCSLVWVIAWRSGMRDVHIGLLPLVLLAAVLATFGQAAARIAAFPVGYLYFAEPLWHVLIRPLQELTVQVVGVIVPVIGMPVTIVGDVLNFSGGVSFEVTPICSGINFLVVGLAAAALIGELQHASFWRRARLIAAMALLMVLSNWVRVLLIIIAGYTSGMRNVLATRGHWYLGWVLFAIVMLGFARVAARGATSSAQAAAVPSPADGP